ncbi:hypothetical protein BAE44_0006765 [Dichanthelium oligosanthes]|uniref:Uncharacterized protein n=1 Tax=Dichanthelium oligosanthes TaxID=888268 RepID=A0A1E5W4F5_9POAL|nr:hypothetical protein BAE44_0006765 [Dichanthelium oligosanthes]
MNKIIIICLIQVDNTNHNGKPSSRKRRHRRIKQDALIVAHTKSTATLVRLTASRVAMAKHLQPKAMKPSQSN